MSTSNRKSAQRHAILLSILCACLGAVVFTEFEVQPLAPSMTRDGDVRISSTPISGDEFAFKMPPLKQFAEVLARPLFSSTRRPLSGGGAGGPATSRPNFRVAGIVLSEAGNDALIEYGHPPRLRRVVEGQDVEGWTIQSIQIDRIIVRRRGASIAIRANPQSNHSRR